MDSVGIWITIGWIIDIVLNGIVWFIIGLCLLPLIDVSDKWTRKAILFMGKVDEWIRNLLELSLEWILKKNLRDLDYAKKKKVNYWTKECEEHPTNPHCLVYCD